jgi:polyisoprenoid-binding protein YceI
MTKTIALIATAGLGFAAETWEVDAVHSTALFAVQHFGAGYTWGRFNGIGGSVVTDADASKNTVSITIKADSIDTANADRDKHLKADGFLNSRQFPNLTFASTAWKQVDAATAEVAGKLTIRDVTKPVTVTVKRTGAGVNPMANNKPIVGFEATFTIKRSEFNVKDLPGAIGEDVRIILAIEAMQKQ